MTAGTRASGSAGGRPGRHPARGPDADQRVVRTRRRLRDALVELAAQRPLDQVSIRDLTDRAGVGYATFFRHYGGIPELLHGMIDDLYAELTLLLPPLSGDEPAQAGAVVFRHVRDHQGLYQLMLGADRSLGLLDRIVEVGVAGLLETYEPRPDAGVPVDVAADHLIASFLNLIRWWLERGMPHSPEQMGAIYRDLVLRPVEASAIRPRA